MLSCQVSKIDNNRQTACSLLLMNAQETDIQETGDETLELQEPTVTYNVPPNVEPIPELMDLTSMLGPHHEELIDNGFIDAMEHIIGRVLVNTAPTALNVPDVVDSMCAPSVLVETATDPKPEYVLVNPEIEQQIKQCSIKLTKIDSVLSYIPKQNLYQTLMHAGRPHTCSMCTPQTTKMW